MCGATLEAIEGQSVATCSYCGSKQTVANSDDDRKEGLFNRANTLRIACEFDKAFAAYQSIISLFPNEAEAHWGLCLCRYGIEYVDDPVSHKKVPTVHRASYESILKDSDYLAALSLADVVAKEQYELEANEIASIQKNFLQISQKEVPFDIFICYKESDGNGRRTPDSVMAQEIYGELTDKGYKVFFSRVTLESKLGSLYEPYIFAALNSAKIMLVIGTRKEYFEATWVKNEWSRYLDLMRGRPDRYLIPCYRDMDAYEMPEGFLSFQAQNLGKLGFMQDLLRGIDKIMGKESLKPSGQEKGYPSSSGVNIRALLKRAEILLGDGDAAKADSLLETVLNNDPENADAYLLKSAIAFGFSSADGLKGLSESPENEPNFKNARKYGDEQQRARLDEILISIANRNKQCAYERALSLKKDGQYEEAEDAFMALGDFKDSAEKAEECVQTLKEHLYQSAIAYRDNGLYHKAAEAFASLGDYKDAKEQIREVAYRKKKDAYDRAMSLKGEGDYESARPQFLDLGDFEDSAFQAEECARLRKEASAEKDYQGAVTMVQGKAASLHTLSAFRCAITLLSHVPGYKDADELKARYESAVKEWEVEQKKEKEELARKKAIRRRRLTKIALISSISALCVTAILLVTFLYFVPEGRQSSIIGALDAKNYDAALTQINANGDYGDNANLRSMCYAGQAFEKNDYEEGIDYVLSAGGNVDVAYDGSGGSCKSSESIRAAKRIDNDPKKEGYTFSGWVIDSYSIDAGSHYAALNLKATYDVGAYNITYVLNGGTNDPANPSSYTIETSDIVLLPAKRCGYDFVGWSDGSSVISTIKKGAYGDLTLTAQWSAISYSITYDLGGGSIEGQKNSYTIEESPTLPQPARAGYRFLGWTGSNGNALEKNVTISKGSVGNKVYQAHWEAVRYLITYVLNGGTNDSANPSSYTIETSGITLLPATRNGYAFAGWSDGSSTVSTIRTGSYGDLTLTAQWSAASYSIVYDLQGGRLENEPISYTVEETVTLPNPERTGYEFLGWTGSNGSTPEKGLTISKGSQGNKTFKANWEIVEYKIAYNFAGGYSYYANPSSYTIESSDITLLSATRTGYTFIGWSDGSSVVSAIKTGTYGDLTLTAQWSAISYGISYDLQGGRLANGPTTYTTENSVALPNPTKNGYAFTGWTGSNGSTPEADYVLPKGNLGNKTYKANWALETYQINYVLGGGSNNSSNPSSYAITSSDITLLPATRDGYTFAGWSNGSSIVSAIQSGSYGNLTLTARWTANKQSLSATSLDEALGTVSVSGVGYTGENIRLTAIPNSDCVFDGWYENGTLISRANPLAFAMPASSRSLQAKFRTKAEKKMREDLGIDPVLDLQNGVVTYGLYPQSHVSDENTVAALNKLTSTEDNDWYLLDGVYYAKTSSNPRATNYSFDDGSPIVSKNTDWFKCEPIKWKILSSSDGVYSLVSTVILDAKRYSALNNRYVDSEIRQWLNDDFYKAAFFLDNSLVMDTKVDNSASTTVSDVNPYAGSNVTDKMYLLSYKDYSDALHFPDSASRMCKTTDWARANNAWCSTFSGSQNNDAYWTRSPDPSEPLYVWTCSDDGDFSNNPASTVDNGVRPGTRIKIV